MSNALNLEASTGTLVVLPILIAEATAVFNRYPLLRDKLYLTWNEGPDAIARKLAATLGRESKSHWTIFHPASHAGSVWLHIVPAPKHVAANHEYQLRWGPWTRRGKLSFVGSSGISLVHSKGDDGLSIPLFVDVSPEAHVTFGQGEAPGSVQVDINDGWTRQNGSREPDA